MNEIENTEETETVAAVEDQANDSGGEETGTPEQSETPVEPTVETVTE